MPVEDGASDGSRVEYILGVPSREGDHWAIQAVNGEAAVVRVKRGPDGGLALRFFEEKDLD